MVADKLTNSDVSDNSAERAVLTEYSFHQGQENSKTWHERALEGFLGGAQEAWENPTKTGLTVGSGLAIGAAIQTGLNNAERMGGKVGTLAKAGKIAMLTVPAALSVIEVATAKDSAEATGRAAFDMSLFLGTAKLGTFADRVPRAGKLFGPRVSPETPLPEGAKFQVYGDTVKYSGFQSTYGRQVRLSNGKGFVADRWDDSTAKLIDMPHSIPGKGRIEYTAEATSLTTERGLTYSRDVGSGSNTSIVKDGRTFQTADGQTFRQLRTNSDNWPETITYQPDGTIVYLRGSWSNGSRWEFKPDGSVSQRSLPAGKYRMSFGPDGEGTSTYTHGTSRGIQGRVGPRSNHSPLVKDRTPVRLADVWKPDVARPDEETTKGLLDAKEVLDMLMRGELQ